MKFIDVVSTALGNTTRSIVRTLLTVTAIFIGAFTLTLTSGLGVGINQYIDRMVQGFGQTEQIYVQKVSETAQPATKGPQEYNPEDVSVENEFGNSLLTQSDVDKIEKISGVDSVEPIVATSPNYIEGENSDKFEAAMGLSLYADTLQYEAGSAPGEDKQEITIPSDWVRPLGYSSSQDAVGQTVKIGITNAVGKEKVFEATVSGVTELMVSGQGGEPTPSKALSSSLYEYQIEGLPDAIAESQGYLMVVANVPDAGKQEAVKRELFKENMVGSTAEDQIGQIRGVINTVIWVLNGFALIALLAAAFGIVNTLLMSVQERTREIGLMKSLGMAPGKIFTLFSAEAVLLGVIGSVVGVGAGVIVGTAANGLLTSEGGPLGDVAGLSLYGIAPLQLLLIVVLIMAIAFIAGTLPAVRAAGKDPIESLRHE